MNRHSLFPRTTFSAALLLVGCALAAPAATISFTGGDGGTIVIPLPSGVNAAVTTFTGIPFNLLQVSGAPVDNGAYTVTSGTGSFNTATNILTLSGAIPALGLSGVTTLATLQTLAGLTANTTGGISFTLNPPTVSSVVLSSTLLSILGLTGQSVSSTAIAVSGLSSTGAPTGPFTASVARLDFATGAPVAGVPEPASWLLLTSGSALLLFLSRRKFSTRA